MTRLTLPVSLGLYLALGLRSIDLPYLGARILPWGQALLFCFLMNSFATTTGDQLKIITSLGT